MVLGTYDSTIGAKAVRDVDEVDFGMGVSLGEARTVLARARRMVERGESPARAKSTRRAAAATELTFSAWAEKYFAEAPLVESTKAMRRSVYDRHLAPHFGRLRLDEITPARLMARCEKIKGRGAAAPAVHAREIVMQVFRFVQGRGLKVENPADAIWPSAIATFKPRDRALTPAEIHVFFHALEQIATMPTLRLAVRFLLLTLVRKSEFIEARWPEVDFTAAVWTIPKERIKAGRAHNGYLSQQSLDILVALRTCFSASSYLHPGRYETDLPISSATLNRVIDATVKQINASGTPFEPFTVHDLRRTASTLLHEAGYNSDWIEKCLAHEQCGVRAAYNKAEYAEQRREMLQAWADMVDGWIVNGGAVVPIGRRAA